MWLNPNRIAYISSGRKTKPNYYVVLGENGVMWNTSGSSLRNSLWRDVKDMSSPWTCLRVDVSAHAFVRGRKNRCVLEKMKRVIIFPDKYPG